MLANFKNKFKVTVSLLRESQKKKIYKIFFFILFGTLLEVLSLTSVLPLASTLTKEDNTVILFLQQGFEFLHLENFNRLDTIYVASILLFLVFSIKNLYLFFLNKFQAKLLTDITSDLRYRAYSKYLNQTIVNIQSKNSYSFINNLILNCQIYSNVFIFAAFQLILELLVFIIFIIILFIYDPFSTFLSFFILGLITTIVIKVNKNSLLIYSKILHDENLSLIKNIQHTFGGIKDIKILKKENFFKNLILKNVNLINISTYKSGLIAIYPRYLLEIVAIFFILLFFNLHFQFENGYLTIDPFLFLFGAAIFRLLPSLTKIIQHINKLRNTIHPVKVLISTFKSLNLNQEQKIKSNKKIKITTPLCIKFNNVSFAYGKNTVLENLNWKIDDNKLIGLFGKSGAGKSTLIDVLTGLKIPNKGKILINNHNLINIRADWFDHIGFVQQDVFMLDDTIKNNIAFGIPKNKINNRLIDNIIKEVGLEEFIKTLPDGIKSNVGERGIRISGGQRQRIAIARALYKKPKILILDEATNGLDSVNEKNIISLLKKLKLKILIILISHKKNIIDNCDSVYLLKNKKILINK